jgi:hypothetical protein
MSSPGWSVPQRIPNGLVIGPDTGQIKAGAPPGGGELEPPGDRFGVSAARS